MAADADSKEGTNPSAPVEGEGSSESQAGGSESCANQELVVQQINQERMQGHRTRQHLYEQVERVLRKPLVCLATSFCYPVMLEDRDADMLEGVLQKTDLSSGLALLVNSPGGDGLGLSG